MHIVEHSVQLLSVTTNPITYRNTYALSLLIVFGTIIDKCLNVAHRQLP